MNRLSELDPDVGGAVRIIAFFDPLVRAGVGFATLVRATAGLAGCPVALLADGAESEVRDGGAPGKRSGEAPVVLSGARVGTVWLERPGGPLPLDEVLLERLALAAAAVWERGGAPVSMTDPALVELVIAEETGEPARARALSLLGLAPGTPLRAFAVGLPADGTGGGGLPAEALATLARRLGGRAAHLGDVGVVLARGGTLAEVATGAPRAEPPTGGPLARSLEAGSFTGVPAGGPPARSPEAGPLTEVPAGVLLGAGPVMSAARADESWRRARVALRFAGPGRPFVDHAELGALAVLADVPRDILAANPDVAAVAALPDSDRETLAAFCARGSLRAAATELHLHHTSVAKRLRNVEARLGLRLERPDDLLRAHLAVVAHGLLS